MEKAGKKISHYSIEKQLGQGMFAKVYLARSDRDNNLYAIKAIQKSVAAAYERK